MRSAVLLRLEVVSFVVRVGMMTICRLPNWADEMCQGVLQSMDSARCPFREFENPWKSAKPTHGTYATNLLSSRSIIKVCEDTQGPYR